MNNIENPNVRAIFEQYPEHIQQKLSILRQLILDTASEIDAVDHVEETLKWGEPSYLTSKGSTIRLGWKEAQPASYAMYFNCNTRLIETFKEVVEDAFRYEGNRAIVFLEDDDIPIQELKRCITLALTYHTRKHLPLLGV